MYAKIKWCLLDIYSESLDEQETLWEHEPLGKCFYSFFEFSQTFTSVPNINRNMENMFSISLRTYLDKNKGK